VVVESLLLFDRYDVLQRLLEIQQVQIQVLLFGGELGDLFRKDGDISLVEVLWWIYVVIKNMKNLLRPQVECFCKWRESQPASACMPCPIACPGHQWAAGKSATRVTTPGTSTTHTP
jgi:hypothetical protein